MKSKKKYNRKYTYRKKRTRKRRTGRSKKIKYSKRRIKMKGGTGLLTGITPSKLKRLQDHNRKFSEEVAEPEPVTATEEREITLLPGILETYPPVTEDEFKTIITSMTRKVTAKKTQEKYNILDGGLLGLISGHGITRQDGNGNTQYFVVPDNISIALMGFGSGLDVTPAYLDEIMAQDLPEANRGFSYYKAGSLCEDYFIEFRAVTPDDDSTELFLNGSTGILTNNRLREIDPDGKGIITAKKLHESIEARLFEPVIKFEEEDLAAAQEFEEIYEAEPNFLFKYYHSDEFNILKEQGILHPLPRPNRYSLGYSKLSDILNKLSEERKLRVEIPSLFICSFCRGGCEGVPGINSLSECGAERLFDLDISLEALPRGSLGITHFDDLSLRRESSLSSSSLLNNFSRVIKELFTYAVHHKTSWLTYIELLYDNIIRNNNNMTYSDDIICILLQLRHTLSLRHVP
jgi:hypothetical protein